MTSGETLAPRPPGDVLLVKHRDEVETFVLFPVPSDDINDPLNWSSWRKALNYALVSAQTVAVFTALSIQPIFWQQMSVDLNLSMERLNNATSANAAGLAVGCILFIPLTKKFGRRSTYVVSTAVMAAVSWWTAYQQTLTELFLTNLLYGLAGATNEAIVQVTVSDMFFIHQRGTMNAVYLTAVMTGSFLTPVAAGVQADRQGWRASYRALAISLTIVFVFFLFGYEETKYIPSIRGEARNLPNVSDYISKDDDDTKANVDASTLALSTTISAPGSPLKPHSYRQRLRWLTPSSEPLWKLTYFPMYVITFPHVLFAAAQYACGVSCLVVQATIISMVFSIPPYNLSPAGLGYMNLGPFVGNLFGSFYTGILSDLSVKWLARRNKGYYEPEMRLYLLLPPALFMAGGQIMFGVTTDKGMHWIFPSIGGALFGFGLGAIGDAALTLVIDSYRPLTAEAFVSITVIRNAVGIPLPFVIVPWLTNMGLKNMFLILGFVSLAVSSLFIPLIIWGKRIRARLAPRYFKLLEKQGGLMATQN
ncbi:major facilitator superfamily domain-containing protein [Pyrenochaeta sp. MPI-SDFR-AT-0127]|nr:major facilitator superfamily domain-containing protein [Pyrenochaeta sp. MPI-SDFR-AT-0127]